MIKILITVMVLNLMSCASTSEKNIYGGDVKFKNGRSGNTTWKADLVFRRMSWFTRATLDYDVLISKFDRTSPFQKWLSPAEQSYLDTCQSILITFYTNNNSRVLSETTLKENLRKYSVRQIAIPKFFENLKLHADFAHWNLNLYKNQAWCAEENIEKIVMSIPSFEETEITL